MNFRNLSTLRGLNLRHLISPLLIGIALLLTATQSLHAQVVVDFPDANLEQVIRDEKSLSLRLTMKMEIL